MKRFLLCLVTILLLSSAILYFKFGYSLTDVGYHLLVMTFVIGLIVVLILALSLIPNLKLRKLLIHSFSFTYFLSFTIFYLLILSSNLFWGKTITLKIVSNYLRKIDGLISILPVKAWIFYFTILLVLALIVLLYLLVRPSTGKISRVSAFRWRRRRTRQFALAALLIAIALPLIFHKQATYLKRRIHFSNEPAFQFALGPMWNAFAVPLAFDTERFKKGLMDQACTDSIGTPPLSADPPTIVVILLDALRRDHLPMYGYSRNTSPFLDSLFKAGSLQIVQNAFSNSNTTSGGVSGLFYSRDWENFGYNGLSLLKFMKRANYKTYAFLTGFHRDWYDLSAIYRTNCDYYYESAINPYANDDDDLPTLAEFSKRSYDKNSFIYIHLLSTHTIGKKNDEFKQFLPDKVNLGVGLKTAFVNNYDNGILQGDFVIREIFSKLSRDGLLKNSIVYIVADHGELFGEDGRFSHGGDVHQDLLNIPIMVYDSASSWYKNLESATIKDIAPSIVDRLGFGIPSCWEGKSLHAAPHDFTIDINSGLTTELPKGRLTRKDSSYSVDIMNAQKQIKKSFTSSGNGSPWQPVNER